MCLVFGLSFSLNLRNSLSRKLHRTDCVLACDDIDPNLKPSMKLMEGPIGARNVPNLAPNAFLVVLFKVPRAIVAPGAQPMKQVGEKKAMLAIWDVHVNGRWGDGAIANILNSCQTKWQR